jgi:RNA polymerase sigma factor (sigma-70 family)
MGHQGAADTRQVHGVVGEASGGEPVLRRLSETRGYETLRLKLTAIAWRRYRIPEAEAEDVAHTAIATYCEVHERYAGEPNPFAILFGIFRKKCLELIDRSVRDLRRLRACSGSPDAARVNPRLDPEGSGSSRPPLELLIRREDVALILEALDELRPEARAMLRLLLLEGVGRPELLDRYSINPNTLDWRLHTYRKEFREVLRRKGVLG